MRQRVDVAWLVDHFDMAVLPVESTYFVRTYTSTSRAADGSAAGSAIVGLFAREPRSRSLFHTVDCDEMWHFYGGDPYRLVLLHPDGSSEVVVMGPDLAAGHRVQHLVPAGVWQAGELVEGGEWALFGCTVTPEFTDDAFRGGHAEELLATHPDRRVDIERLAVPADQPRALTGTPDSCAVNMGLIHLQAGDLVSAYRYFLPMAEKGDGAAIDRLVEICELAGDTSRAESWRAASTVES